MIDCWLQPGCIGMHARNRDAEYGRSRGPECIRSGAEPGRFLNSHKLQFLQIPRQ